MGWKGTVRSIGAAVRAAERDAKRRQRELEKQKKQYEKMQELEQAEYEVEVHENEIEIIQSIHKECSARIDWEKISKSVEPKTPINLKSNEESARLKADNYKPSFIDKILKREEKKRTSHSKNIINAIEEDKAEYSKVINNWENEVTDWRESVVLSKRLLKGDEEAKIKAIEELDPFSEIYNLGSGLTITTNDSGLIGATIHIHGNYIVPSEIKSLLKSGKLSVKNMPKGRFNEIYQDYVCSCALRIANEIFSIIPDDMVTVTAVDELLSPKTGHLEKSPILSVCVSRSTLDSLNMSNIDPSDSMSNFIHNMSFKKTKGFEPVELVSSPS